MWCFIPRWLSTEEAYWGKSAQGHFHCIGSDTCTMEFCSWWNRDNKLSSCPTWFVINIGVNSRPLCGLGVELQQHITFTVHGSLLHLYTMDFIPLKSRECERSILPLFELFRSFLLHLVMDEGDKKLFGLYSFSVYLKTFATSKFQCSKKFSMELVVSLRKTLGNYTTTL